MNAEQQRRKISLSDLQGELEFQTSRSSGPGGQNVNKVNSKVTLRFSITDSPTLTEEEKRVLLEKLAAKVTNDGVLVLSSQEKRSQGENKEAVLNKFDLLLRKAFEKRKARRKTRPTKASKEKRIESKKKKSEKKQWRQKF